MWHCDWSSDVCSSDLRHGRTWGPGREMTDVVVEGPAPPAGDGPQGLRKPGRRTHVGDAQQHQPGPRGQAGEHLSVVAAEAAACREVRHVVGAGADEDDAGTGLGHSGDLAIRDVGYAVTG